MGQLLSNLANGSLVKLNENSQGKKFIKLDNDHYGSGTGVTMLRKDTFNERQWEASYDNDYKNRYIGCLLDNFCDLMWPQMLDPEIRGLHRAGAYRGCGGQRRGYAAHHLPQGICPVLHRGGGERLADGGQEV